MIKTVLYIRDSKYESYIINIRVSEISSYPFIYGRELREDLLTDLLIFRDGSPRSSLPDACDHPSSVWGTLFFLS